MRSRRTRLPIEHDGRPARPVDHDVRNSLASIWGCAETLLDRESHLDRPTRHALTEAILEQSRRLEHLLDGVINGDEAATPSTDGGRVTQLHPRAWAHPSAAGSARPHPVARGRRLVVVADSQEVARRGIRAMLETIDDVYVVGEASSGAEALRACAEHAATALVLDLRMPDIDGIETIRRLRRSRPRAAVVVLTNDEDEAVVVDAICAGASAYLTKSASLGEMRDAIASLDSSGVYLSPAVAARLLASVAGDPGDEILDPGVTPRERQVLDLLAHGLAARAIGSRLGISERTVNSHIESLYRRLGVTNRVDCLREAMRRRLVAVPR